MVGNARGDRDPARAQGFRAAREVLDRVRARRGGGRRREGAGAITEALAERGVRAWFSLDEGMAILAAGRKLLRGAPLALDRRGREGLPHAAPHRARPGRPLERAAASTAIGRLARAIVRLEEHPLPARTEGVVSEMLRAVAPHTGGLRGLCSPGPACSGR